MIYGYLARVAVSFGMKEIVSVLGDIEGTSDLIRIIEWAGSERPGGSGLIILWYCTITRLLRLTKTHV